MPVLLAGGQRSPKLKLITMHISCTCCSLPRRGFLTRTLAAGAAAGLALAAPWARAAGGATTHVTAAEALERLKAGNAHYVGAPDLCTVDVTHHRGEVAKSQAPWATILSCADSRVPPELLFGGVGLGELFVARNAGNMADTATLGTLEYGSGVLGVPLIVVLGHQRCGAVAAACEVVDKRTAFPGSIGPMVEAIVPAATRAKGLEGDHVDNTVRESARLTVQKIITQSDIIGGLVAKGKVQVVAARYDLDTGRVEYLN